MKKHILVFIAALGLLHAQAQTPVSPMNANTLAELKEVEWTFPGMKPAPTKIKYLISPTKVGFQTAFSINITRDGNGKPTNIQTADVATNYPIDLLYKISVSASGNQTTASIQVDDQSGGGYVDFGRDIIYKDIAGRDSLVIVEQIISGPYEELRRMQLIYNANGTMAGWDELQINGGVPEVIGQRRFGYNGTKRITDTTYLVTSGTQSVKSFNVLMYNGQGQLDSVMTYTSDGVDETLISGYRMVHDANGIAEIFATEVSEGVASFAFRIQYTATLVGIKEQTLGADAIQVYPVPASGKFWINSLSGDAVNYKLFDLTGRLIDASVNAAITHELQAEKMQSGMYILHISNNKGQSRTEKVLVEN